MLTENFSRLLENPKCPYANFQREISKEELMGFCRYIIDRGVQSNLLLDQCFKTLTNIYQREDTNRTKQIAGKLSAFREDIAIMMVETIASAKDITRTLFRIHFKIACQYNR